MIDSAGPLRFLRGTWAALLMRVSWLKLEAGVQSDEQGSARRPFLVDPIAAAFFRVPTGLCACGPDSSAWFHCPLYRVAPQRSFAGPIASTTTRPVDILSRSIDAPPDGWATRQRPDFFAWFQPRPFKMGSLLILLGLSVRCCAPIKPRAGTRSNRQLTVDLTGGHGPDVRCPPSSEPGAS